MDRGRKEGVKRCGRGRGAGGVLWARNDSRPDEKAKEPRGRAESERRRRWWREGLGERLFFWRWGWGEGWE